VLDQSVSALSSTRAGESNDAISNQAEEGEVLPMEEGQIDVHDSEPTGDPIQALATTCSPLHFFSLAKNLAFVRSGVDPTNEEFSFSAVLR
jgi:hypothetical protein